MDEETIDTHTPWLATLAADILSLSKLIRAATPYLVRPSPASINYNPGPIHRLQVLPDNVDRDWVALLL